MYSLPPYYCSANFLELIEEKRLLGINPRITISSDTKIIKSPLLMWSESNAFVRFRYTMTKPSKVFAVKSILCYPTLGGRLRRALWSTIVYIKARKQGQLCLRMINPNRNLCKTYKALLTLRPVKGGVLGFDRLDFGGPELCTLQKKKPTTFKCDFEKDGCGIRTDFCSLYDWTIQNRGSSFSKGSDREKRSFGSRKGSSGLALMKRNITGDSCSYPICIPCFQQSGIDVTVIKHPGLFYFGTRNSRERRDLRGVSLFLDPSRRPREGVGPAIADLPEVQYDPDNAYLSFFHEMVPGGKHVLVVRAVCTGRVANDLIPLGPLRLPYANYQLLSRGCVWVCLYEYSPLHRRRFLFVVYYSADCVCC